jgi:hypothetical protein
MTGHVYAGCGKNAIFSVGDSARRGEVEGG